MNRATIQTCTHCWAEMQVSEEDRTPVKTPTQKWVVTDLGSSKATAMLHEDWCPWLPTTDLLTPSTAPEGNEGDDEDTSRP